MFTVTRNQKDRLRRFEEFSRWKPPSARTAILPTLPKGSTVAALTFTLMDGVKWRVSTHLYYITFC